MVSRAPGKSDVGEPEFGAAGRQAHGVRLRRKRRWRRPAARGAAALGRWVLSRAGRQELEASTLQQRSVSSQKFRALAEAAAGS